MENDSVQQFVETISQQHLLKGLESVNPVQKQVFFDCLKKYGKETLLMQRSIVASQTYDLLPKVESPRYLLPSNEIKEEGIRAVKNGKIACLLLSGGQGSRLGFDGPKGICPVSAVRKKTLFQIVFEKVKVLSDICQKDLQLAIMTSSKNDEQTKEYIESNNYFGLKKEQVSFFSQENLPFMSKEGNWLLERPGCLAEGPCGNGSALLHLYESTVLEKWKKLGVEYVNVIPVDNPLANPFDFELAGIHILKIADVAVKAVERQDPHESVGVFAMMNNKLHIVEYSDLSDIDKTAVDSKGGLKLPLANTGLMSFSIKFIEEHVDKVASIPWHLALKKTKLLDQDEKAWKFERYIFDLFIFTDAIYIIKCDRSYCYSALKNAEGDKSVNSVARDLSIRFKQLYEELSGLHAPDREFELASEFWYPSQEMIGYWKGKPLPNQNYIEAYPL